MIWSLAVVLEWLTPRLIDDSGFHIAAKHFVERHGLVLIVAIGESIVVIGVGAAGLAVDLPLVLVAILGLALSACLWWTYFGGDDARAEEALAGAPRERRPRLAIDAFGYALPAVARDRGYRRGSEEGDRPRVRPAQLRGVTRLRCGPSVRASPSFSPPLSALPSYRAHRSEALGRGARTRHVPLGTEVAAVAQLAALVALMAAMFAFENAAVSRSPTAVEGVP